MREEQEKRLKKKEFVKTMIGYFLFLFTSILAVSVAVLVYDEVAKKSGDNRAVIAIVILLVAMALALFFTVFDIIRRRFTLEKPVREILLATEKIAAGDFSVRVPIARAFEQYEEIDVIKENLNLMAEELSKTELMRTDFISSVSHEIKTPLSVIRNYAKALGKDDLDEASRKRYAAALTEAAEKLTALVGNILKLNKLENLEIVPELAEIDLGESLRECVLALEELIERKNLELVCDIEDVTVLAPPDLLEIVWNNLLSNAVKFTDEGGRVEVSLKKAGEYAVVTVADTGCGIPSDAGARIFEKFYQGDGSHSKEGNGLGLALVKKVIDLSGGEISVKSVLKKGTTFTVKLKTGL